MPSPTGENIATREFEGIVGSIVVARALSPFVGFAARMDPKGAFESSSPFQRELLTRATINGLRSKRREIQEQQRTALHGSELPTLVLMTEDQFQVEIQAGRSDLDNLKQLLSASGRDKCFDVVTATGAIIAPMSRQPLKDGALTRRCFLKGAGTTGLVVAGLAALNSLRVASASDNFERLTPQAKAAFEALTAMDLGIVKPTASTLELTTSNGSVSVRMDESGKVLIAAEKSDVADEVSLVYAYLPVVEFHLSPDLPLREYAERIDVDGEKLRLGNLGTLIIERDGVKLKEQFNTLTSSGEFCWTGIHPQQGAYWWDWAESFVRSADQMGMQPQLLHLVWGLREYLPDWLKNGNFSKEQILEVVRDHCHSVVSYFKTPHPTYQRRWSVINELFGTGMGTYPVWSNLFLDKMGGDIEEERLENAKELVRAAFYAAREADPEAFLFINDYGMDFGGEFADRLYGVVAPLVTEGVPIQSVGLQSHLWIGDFCDYDLRDIDEGRLAEKIEQLRTQIRRWKALELKVSITELDIAINGLSGANRFDVQARVYGEYFKVCLEERVESVTVFGLRDSDSWWERQVASCDPLLYYDDGTPKPAYFAVQSALYHAASA